MKAPKIFEIYRKLKKIKSEILDEVSSKRKVLWQNSASTQQFNNQTIKLADDDYDELEIIYKIVTNNSFMLNIKISKGMQTYLTSTLIDNSQINVYQRIFAYVDSVTYQVGDCHKMTSTTYQGIDNTGVIPYKIVGYKYQ